MHLFSGLSNFEPPQLEVDRDRGERVVDSMTSRQMRVATTTTLHEELVRRYKAGETVKALAAEFGMHHGTVKTILVNADVKIRTRTRLTNEQLNRARKLYTAGSTTIEIARELGYDASTVGRALIKSGITLRPPGRLSQEPFSVVMLKLDDMVRLHSLNDANPDHTGLTIFQTEGKFAYPTLRVQAVSETRNDISDPRIKAEFEQHNKAGLPWLPKTDSSVFVKTPGGVLYETDMHSIRTKLQGTITVDKNQGDINKIFNPYLSWHGGWERNEPVGSISLRGLTAASSHTHKTFNTTPAIARDSLAGNYNAIATVTLPRSVIGFPALPISSVGQSAVLTLEKFEDRKSSSPTTPVGLPDLAVDREIVSSGGGASVVIFVHYPGPLHSSRFSPEQRSQWLTEPVTLIPSDKAPLALTIVLVRCQVEVVIDDAPLIFVGHSSSPDKNLVFSAFKVK